MVKQYKYLLLVLIITVLSLVPNLKQALAQSTVFCPEGFICTPINPQPVNCPPNYICTPTTSTNNTSNDPLPTTSSRLSDARVTITTGSLDLAYDSSHGEASLKATYYISINGGSNGVVVYKDGAIGGFSKSRDGSITSTGPISSTLVSVGNTTSSVDYNGRTVYVVGSNKTARFVATISANPKQMFAGTYRGVLQAIYANTSSSNGQEFKLNVIGGLTNPKTIVGEVSPYITSVTTPIRVGDKMNISGQRLGFGNGFTVDIDGKPVERGIVDGSRDGTTVFFVMPYIPDGYHTISITDSRTGASNRVGFQAGNIVTTPPIPVNVQSLNLVNPNGMSRFDYDKLLPIDFYVSSSNKRVSINLVDSNNAGYDLISYNNYYYHNISDPYIISNAGRQSVSLYMPKEWISSHGSQYKIEICAMDQCDKSDNFFSINSTTQPVYPTYPDTSNLYGENISFAKEFSVNNTFNPVNIDLAADNQYTVLINGNVVASSVGDWNFNSVHTHNITPYIRSGYNKLEIKVFNNYATGASQTGLGNPAGLIYKIYQGNSPVASSDGNETTSISGGRAVLLSQKDPSWINIDGAKWIWSTDYYYGTWNQSQPTTPIPATPVIPAPTVYFRVNPSTVTAGEMAILSWRAYDANSCTATGFSTNGSISGSQKINPAIASTINYSITCTGNGGSKTEYATLNVTPVSQTSVSTYPLTAKIRIGGEKEHTYNVGETNNYEWSSTGPADKFSSSYTSVGPAVCGGGPWVANTANGSSRTFISERYAGCTWRVTYTVGNSRTGESVSDTVLVKVNPLPTAPIPAAETTSESSNPI